MGTSFGNDFGDVRIHTDGESDALNRSVGANAFTLGSDIFLSQAAASAGPYGGDRLLAHELTHVVQQRGAGRRGPLTVSGVSDPEEHEASASAAAVADGGTARPAERVQPGVATARVQRDGARPVGVDAVAGMQNEIAVLKKKEQADAMDLRWRGTFGEKLARYQQAVSLVAAGIDTANDGFKQAQDSQARADQMWHQVLGLAAAVVFSAAFEWLAAPALGKIGTLLKKTPGDVIESVENPANALVGGLVTNVHTTHVANEDAESGAAPPIDGFASASAFLATQGAALFGHAADIEHAFTERVKKTDAFNDDQWLQLDLGEQEKKYEALFAQLDAAGRDASALAPPGEIARILERHMWAAWIKQQDTGARIDTLTPAQKRFGLYTMADVENAEVAMDDFGSDINQRLIDLGVEALSGAPLSTHWWEVNGDHWAQNLLTWAKNYNESIAR
jgi:hypothetical protein